MDHSHQEELDWDELKRLGYEPQDLDVGMAVKGTVAFYGFVVLALAMAGVIFFWINRDAFLYQPTPAREFYSRIPQAPYPVLQTNITTKTDIMELRQHERQVLTSYGQVDADHLRIPIDRAIDLVLQQGLVKGEAHPLAQGNDE